MNGSFTNYNLSYEKPMLSLTYQTVCSAQDTTNKQYCRCDAVMESEHHVVYHSLVYEESYFDKSGN
jgi:hypothetical protein